jgi:hypothetical protein
VQLESAHDSRLTSKFETARACPLALLLLYRSRQSGAFPTDSDLLGRAPFTSPLFATGRPIISRAPIQVLLPSRYIRYMARSMPDAVRNIVSLHPKPVLHQSENEHDTPPSYAVKSTVSAAISLHGSTHSHTVISPDCQNHVPSRRLVPLIPSVLNPVMAR